MFCMSSLKATLGAHFLGFFFVILPSGDLHSGLCVCWKRLPSPEAEKRHLAKKTNWQKTGFASTHWKVSKKIREGERERERCFPHWGEIFCWGLLMITYLRWWWSGPVCCCLYSAVNWLSTQKKKNSPQNFHLFFREKSLGDDAFTLNTHIHTLMLALSTWILSAVSNLCTFCVLRHSHLPPSLSCNFVSFLVSLQDLLWYILGALCDVCCVLCLW